MGELKKFKIIGIPLPMYLLITALVFVAIMLGWVPKGMIGAFAVTMVFGGLLNTIGNHVPIVKTCLSDGVIVYISASAVLMTFGVIPEAMTEGVDGFMNATRFLNFYVAALVTGSILGMNQSLLLRAAVRFLPVALCAMTFTISAVGFVGVIIGYGFIDTVMYVAIPMMGGGMGAGVVPPFGTYTETLSQESIVIISRMIPASTLGSVCTIIGAGLLARLGETKPGLTGNGRLVREDVGEITDSEMLPTNVQMIGIGMILAPCFYLVGTMINKLVPSIHTYAWMIIAVTASKALGIIPSRFKQAAKQWSSFVMGNWAQALLVGIGISMIDLNAMVSAFSLTYMILVPVVVGGVALGAGVDGYLVGFYPVESSITAGLCTTNMGGTRDIVVLSATRRMELLPFAQIATRICGTLVLIVASVLVKMLL